MNAVPTHTATATGPASTAPPSADPVPGLSHEARNLQWLLQNFIEEVPGVRSVAVVSSDGLLLLSSQPAAGSGPGVNRTGASGSSSTRSRPQPPVRPRVGGQGGPLQGRALAEPRMDLAAVVSGLASLTVGAAKLMDGGRVRQTTVAMEDGMLFVTSISDGSLLGVHATAACDMSVVAYHMALFVGRAGHVLTPGLRSELRQAMESSR